MHLCARVYIQELYSSVKKHGMVKCIYQDCQMFLPNFLKVSNVLPGF